MSHLLPLELWQQILSHCEPVELCCLVSCYKDLVYVIPKQRVTDTLVRRAAATEQWTTLELLLQRVTDKHNQRTYTCAAVEEMLGSGQSVSLLQHFIDTFRVWSVPSLSFFCYGIGSALKGGHLAVVDWFLDYLRIDCTRESPFLRPIFKSVVETGDKQLLLWFIDKFKLRRCEVTYNHCDIVITAARLNHLPVVKCFIETYDLCKSDFQGGFGTIFILITATHFGRLEVIQYLVDALEITVHDVNLSQCHHVLPHRAAVDGQVHALDWLQDHFPMTEEAIIQCETFPSSVEHLQVLQWLHTKWTTLFLIKEEGRQQVEEAFRKVLRWMHLQSAQWIAATFPFITGVYIVIPYEFVARCIKQDRLDMFKWAIDKGYVIFNRADMHEYAVEKVVKHKRQDILQYLRETYSLSPES